jgi:hypothetical protein
VREPTPSPAAARRRWAVAYWAAAIVTYAMLGVFFQPFFLLGFWESMPFLLLVTWLASRLFPRPPAPAPAADPE